MAFLPGVGTRAESLVATPSLKKNPVPSPGTGRSGRYRAGRRDQQLRIQCPMGFSFLSSSSSSGWISAARAGSIRLASSKAALASDDFPEWR